jgi:predicted nucleic acid-binding protein
MSRRVVADTSPLIGLQRIGRLDLLEILFGEIIVPPAVMHEFTRRGEPPAWLVERAPVDNPDLEAGTSALACARGGRRGLAEP